MRVERPPREFGNQVIDDGDAARRDIEAEDIMPVKPVPDGVIQAEIGPGALEMRDAVRQIGRIVVPENVHDDAVRRHVGRERVPHDIADKIHHGDPDDRAADIPERDIEFRLVPGGDGAVDDDGIDDQQNLHRPVNVPGIFGVFFPLRVPAHQGDGADDDRHIPENQQQVRRPVGAQRRFAEARDDKVPGPEKRGGQEPEQHHVDMRGPQAAEDKLRDAREQIRGRQLIGHGQPVNRRRWQTRPRRSSARSSAAESGRSSRSQSDRAAVVSGRGASSRDGSRVVMDMVGGAS